MSELMYLLSRVSAEYISVVPTATIYVSKFLQLSKKVVRIYNEMESAEYLPLRHIATD